MAKVILNCSKLLFFFVQRDHLRTRFDGVLVEHMKKSSEDSFSQLFHWILIFHTEGIDDQRLVSVSIDLAVVLITIFSLNSASVS